MKRVILLVTMIVVFCLTSFPVFSQQLTTKPKGQDEWEMFNQNEDVVATFKRTEEGNYKLYSADGKYVGAILRSGQFRQVNAGKRRTTISPEAAQLYLEALNAIRAMQ
jgi:hypothetical protein